MILVDLECVDGVGPPLPVAEIAVDEEQSGLAVKVSAAGLEVADRLAVAKRLRQSNHYINLKYYNYSQDINHRAVRRCWPPCSLV